MQDFAARYEEKYQTALERQANPPPGSKASQLDADVAAAKKDMEAAFALEAKYLTQDGAMTPAEQKDLVANARDRIDLTTDRATRRTDFKSAERRMTMLTGINKRKAPRDKRLAPQFILCPFGHAHPAVD